MKWDSILIGTVALAVMGQLGLLSLSRADAGGGKRAGSRGYVTAYEADGATVIDVRACPNGYAGCGTAFRQSVNDHLCAKHGPGRHSWLYQIGDGKNRVPNTAVCK